MKKKNLLGVKRYGRETRETHTGNDDGDEKWTKFLEIQSKTMFKTEKRKVKKNYDDWLLNTHKKTKINTRKYHSFLHSFQHSTWILTSSLSLQFQNENNAFKRWKYDEYKFISIIQCHVGNRSKIRILDPSSRSAPNFQNVQNGSHFALFEKNRRYLEIKTKNDIKWKTVTFKTISIVRFFIPPHPPAESRDRTANVNAMVAHSAVDTRSQQGGVGGKSAGGLNHAANQSQQRSPPSNMNYRLFIHVRLTRGRCATKDATPHHYWSSNAPLALSAAFALLRWRLTLAKHWYRLC